MKHRTIEYRSYDDDFAGTHIHTRAVTGDFHYQHQNPLWQLCAFLIRFTIGYPVVALICKVGYGLKFENLHGLRQIKTACYVYGNHTQILDVFVPHFANYPHRTYILAGADAVSIPGLKNLVQMLGAIPIPTTLSAMRPFVRTLEQYQKKRCIVTVYPEAHIWPYCTKIRPFPSTSFEYPVRAELAAVAMVTTYRRGLLYPLTHRPSWTVTFSDPFYPDRNLPRREATQKLRDEIYDFMVQCSENHENVETLRYVHKTPEQEKQA